MACSFYRTPTLRKILEIDIKTGKVSSILRLSRGKISEPFINGGKMFIVKNDEIIKLN